MSHCLPCLRVFKSLSFLPSLQDHLCLRMRVLQFYSPVISSECMSTSLSLLANLLPAVLDTFACVTDYPCTNLILIKYPELLFVSVSLLFEFTSSFSLKVCHEVNLQWSKFCSSSVVTSEISNRAGSNCFSGFPQMLAGPLSGCGSGHVCNP